jgi:hypothetical protein
MKKEFLILLIIICLAPIAGTPAWVMLIALLFWIALDE